MKSKNAKIALGLLVGSLMTGRLGLGQSQDNFWTEFYTTGFSFSFSCDYAGKLSSLPDGRITYPDSGGSLVITAGPKQAIIFNQQMEGSLIKAKIEACNTALLTAGMSGGLILVNLKTGDVVDKNASKRQFVPAESCRK